MSKKIGMAAAVIFSSLSLSANCLADEMKTYMISITNITPGQPIAPALVVTHRSGMSFFTVGEAPPDELAPLAEAGNGKLMAEKLSGMANVTSALVAGSGIAPGGSISVTISAKSKDHFSFGAMLGNTNDAFVALTDVALPKANESVTYMAPAYDAGTETNSETCATVPGPACSGEALSPEDSGEGIVTIHNGIHGIGGLSAAQYDWRNPVAKVVITSVKQ